MTCSESSSRGSMHSKSQPHCACPVVCRQASFLLHFVQSVSDTVLYSSVPLLPHLLAHSAVISAENSASRSTAAPQHCRDGRP
jgi:hypothetical protein